jgi:hypothetical protein
MRFTAFHLLFVALLRGNDDNYAMAQSEAPTTSAPTTTVAPTSSPSAAPSFGPPPDCYDDLDEIYAREEKVTDSTVWREYILCPDTEYIIGTFNRFVDERILFVGGFTPISPRNNVHYKCGSDGSSSNNCVLVGGSFHVLSFGTQFEEVQGNVTMEGITFESAFRITLFLGNAGDITFQDCVIRVSDSLCDFLALANFVPFGSPLHHFIFRKIKTKELSL